MLKKGLGFRTRATARLAVIKSGFKKDQGNHIKGARRFLGSQEAEVFSESVQRDIRAFEQSLRSLPGTQASVAKRTDVGC